MIDTKKYLQEFVGINSVYPGEKEFGLRMEKELQNLGFEVSRQYLTKERFNLLGQKGNGGKSILLYGHLDTVAPVSDWKQNPFEVVFQGDIAYGLGVVDMKGNIIALLKAVENFVPKNYSLKFVLGVDEENISQGAHLICGSDFCQEVEAVFVAESGVESKEHDLPFNYILGRVGRFLIDLKVQGKSVHLGRKLENINPIIIGAKLVDFLNDHLPEISVENKFLGRSRSFIVGLNSTQVGLSMPESINIEVDCLLVPPETSQSKLSKVRELIRQFEKEIKIGSLQIKADYRKRKTPFLEPYITSFEAKIVTLVERVLQREYNQSKPQYSQSVADECVFADVLKVPVVSLGVRGGDEHSAKEWVSVSSIDKMAEIYQKIFKEIDENYKF